MAVKSTICGVMHHAHQFNNASGRNHKSQIKTVNQYYFLVFV